jgi:hypothetical protein
MCRLTCAANESASSPTTPASTAQAGRISIWERPRISALQQVVDAIDAGGDVDRIWDRALRVLEEFAAGAGGEGRKRR